VGVQQILAAARNAGKFAGMFCSGPMDANRRIEQGFRFLNASGDVRMAARAARAALEEIRR